MQTAQSTATTTNNGWDVIYTLNNSGLSYAATKLVPDSFQLTISDVNFNITCKPTDATGNINDQNLISITFPVAGTPSDSSSNANDFSGEVIVQFDISQVAMNRVTNPNSLVLNGTSAYMDADNSDSLPAADGFAIEAWVKTEAYDQLQPIVSYGKKDNLNSSLTITEAATIKFCLSTECIESESLTDSNLWDGNWHHVAVSVSKEGAISFYLDGVAQGSGTLSNTNVSASGSPFTIGSYNNTDFFKGNITDVRVWKTSRTQEEIQQGMNVNFENVTSSNRAGLIELWNFSSGDVEPINVIDGNTGTKEGGAKVDQEAVVVADTYVNFLSSNIDLSVKTMNLTGVDETEFINAMMTAIKNLIPYAQLVDPNFQFNPSPIYQKKLLYQQPTSANFITLATSYSDNPNQLLALSMLDNRLQPAGDQNSIFADETTILIPDNTTANLVVSIWDYIVLLKQKDALVITGKFNSDDLSLSNATGSWILSLNKTKFFIKILVCLTDYESQIKKNVGFTNTRSTSSPLAQVTINSTRTYTPEEKTDNFDQKIDMSVAKSATGSVNGIFLAVLLVILLVVCIAIGAAAGGPIGAIIGFIVAIILYAIFAIVDATFLVPLIKTKREDFKALSKVPFHNYNADLTVLNYRYDQAQIMEGSLSVSSFDMSLSPAVIYYNAKTSLQVSLFNYTGAAVTLSTSSSDPSVITITLPSFLDDDLSNLTIDLQDWDYALNGQSLTLTNKSQASWGSGQDNAITFEISGVTCTTEFPSTGFMKINITYTSVSVSPMSARLSYEKTAPGYNTINWAALNTTSNGFSDWQDTNGNSVTSGSKKISNQAEGFVPLATAKQTISDSVVSWQLGYENLLTGGTVAVMKSDKGTSSSAQYAISPGSGDSSTVYFGRKTSNAGFKLTYPED